MDHSAVRLHCPKLVGALSHAQRTAADIRVPMPERSRRDDAFENETRIFQLLRPSSLCGGVHMSRILFFCRSDL